MALNEGLEALETGAEELPGRVSGRPMRSIRQQVRHTSARLQGQVSWLLGVLVVVLLLERFGAVLLEVYKGGTGTPAWQQQLVLKALTAAPEALYLLSLWWIRQAMGEFAEGALFSPLVVRLLKRTGLTLAAGALFTVGVLPTLSWWLGAGPGYWVAYDPSSTVLGAMGLSLRVLAGALQRAAELQTELDEIF